jgi:Raf kinase inhibitor-like YbhB/YbcL family protein
MDLTSPELSGQRIPSRSACFRFGGQNISPELRWKQAPDADNYALVMRDLNVEYLHWIVIGIPGHITHLPAMTSVNSPMIDTHSGYNISQVMNTSGSYGYAGPCPPQGETHRYSFTIYSLRAPLVDSGNDIHRVLGQIMSRSFSQSTIVADYTSPVVYAEGVFPGEYTSQRIPQDTLGTRYYSP